MSIRRRTNSHSLQLSRMPELRLIWNCVYALNGWIGRIADRNFDVIIAFLARRAKYLRRVISIVVVFHYDTLQYSTYCYAVVAPFPNIH